MCIRHFHNHVDSIATLLLQPQQPQLVTLPLLQPRQSLMYATVAALIVHHHAHDSLCQWKGALEDFWRSLNIKLPNQVYVALVQLPKRFLPDRSYHNLYRLLCGSFKFWLFLAYSKCPVLDDELVQWAKRHHLGHG